MADFFLSQYLLITFLLLLCHIKQFGVSVIQAIENYRPPHAKRRLQYQQENLVKSVPTNLSS